MPEPYRLTADERRKITDDGFVVRDAVFTRDECARMIADIERLERDMLAAKRNTKHVVGSYMFELQREHATVVKWEPNFPDHVQGIEPFAHISPALDAWARDPRLWNPSKDIVGQEDLSLFTEKITMKRAHTGGTIILHQDYPYWRGMTKCAHKVMTAMIYLDDAMVENGCLEVAPGSHRDGLVPDRKNIEGFGSLEMDDSKFDLSTLIPVEAKAGAVIFFGAFLVHRSLPNRSAKNRMALLYSYQPAGYPTSREIARIESRRRREAAQA